MARWLAGAGVVSPMVLVAVSVVVVGGRPDYSQVSQTLSELGAVGRPGAETMNWLGIIPAGVLIAISSPSVTRWFGRGPFSMTGGLLLGAGGLLLSASALMPWRGGLPAAERAVANAAHLALALAGFAMIGLAPLCFGLHASQRSAGRVSAALSLLAGVLILALAAGQVQGQYIGAFQRTALAVFYVWLAGTCAVILVGRP